MSKKVIALVTPELLIWARETSGFSIESVAKKLHIPPDKLSNWESGNSPISIAQLGKLAEIYKRPLAVFFLSTTPKKFKVPHDYRKVYGEHQKSLSPQLLYEIRRAQERRTNALDLFEFSGEKAPHFDLSSSLKEEPQKLSEILRIKLNISLEEQYSWASDYQALNYWKRAIENLGVLVFQTQRLPKNEMRAFSLSEKILPLIVLNSSDEVRARIFSLIHELVHLVINDEGICNIEDPDQEAEVFCNRVAGELLVPADSLKQQKIFRDAREGKILTEVEISSAANRYKVSREALLRRLLINGAISESFYKEKRSEYQIAYEKRLRDKTKKHGFVQPSDKVILSSGRFYTSLVLRTYYREKITANAVSNYLDVKLRHLPKIEASINLEFY